VASPFEILQVDPDADEEAIKEAYRRRVKESHPDHGGSTSEFRRVRAAYEEIKAGDAPDPRRVEATTGDGVADPDGTQRVDEGRTAGWHSGVGERSGVDERATGGGRAGVDPAREGDQPDAEVEYLNYEVLDDHGWALEDDDLFEKAADAGLDPADYGTVDVASHESLLQGVEDQGCTWPYACRGGACANCAVAVTEGELSMPVDHILPPEMTDRQIQLSCVGTPATEELRVVYNVKHLPDLDDLRLPPRPFRQAQPTD
jgi:ferredoxin